MRLGENERIILSLQKKYPELTNKESQFLFTFLTHKKTRIDLIIHSLKIKGFLKKDGSLIKSSVNNLDLPDVNIQRNILENIRHLDDSIKLGNLAKSILYVISKTEKCSLQFLNAFFNKPVKNVYAILQRLEQKRMVFSFNSRIKHVDAKGRRYNPKYYVITDLGRTWLEIFIVHVMDVKKIDDSLSRFESEINMLKSKV